MPIQISIKNGKIKCDPQGGHLVGDAKQQVSWVGDRGVQFTLIFENYRTGAPAWPFKDPPAPTAWPQPDFSGILTDDPAAPICYKYSVKVTGYADLDPIIIVNK